MGGWVGGWVGDGSVYLLSHSNANNFTICGAFPHQNLCLTVMAEQSKFVLTKQHFCRNVDAKFGNILSQIVLPIFV